MVFQNTITEMYDLDCDLYKYLVKSEHFVTTIT